ncbi:MAG: LPS-assembly protein LptD [Kiloniellaceae bacterium]
MLGGIKTAVGALAGALLLLGALAWPVAAQGLISDVPALISADRITYDENLGVVTASGNVEISQDGRVLLADTVSYNVRNDVVSASGNVSLLEPTGEVIFADFVELTQSLREGFIRDIRILLTDRSRLAAASALRTGGNRTVFRKAVFSPCELCREDPTRAPLWQLKAIEVEHDQEDKVIRYRDAWMEIFGVPVFYTPYFEHPDPTVERKTGFLAPTIGSSEVLGATYQQPFYWAIGPNRDATIAPIITTKQSIAVAGEYRELYPYGTVTLRGSGTVADREETDGTIEEDRFRGHIDGTGRFEINQTWRSGVDVQRATDDTYLRIYNFSTARTLTSRAFVEGFNGRNYLAANGYLFQGLRATDRQSESPIVLPLVDYNYVGEPGVAGGHNTLDANLMALTRRDGRDSRRLSASVGWELPYTGPAGDVYTVTARVQGDGYWVNDVDPESDEVNPTGPRVDDLTGRILPQLAVKWRYPWVRHDGSINQVVEPMAQAVAAPGGANPDEIPNEDSLDFEFDDTNLFSLNRFPGLDRVDSGSRFDYGIQWTLTGEGVGYTSAFIGQSFRVREADVFPDNSGVEDNFSDIVGRVQVKPTHELDLLYRFRFDKDDLEARRSEVDVRVGPPALNLDLGYIFIDSELGQDEFGEREELNWTLSSKLSRYWSAFGGQRIDLTKSETRQARVGLTYQDECFLIQAVAERNFFSDREIEPENSFFVSIVFKHLGGVSTADTPNLFQQ